MSKIFTVLEIAPNSRSYSLLSIKLIFSVFIGIGRFRTAPPPALNYPRGLLFKNIRFRFIFLCWKSGAYPGFPVGEGANPPGEGGRQHTNLPDFPKNCMQIRKLWSVGGVPLGSATGNILNKKYICKIWLDILAWTGFKVVLWDQLTVQRFNISRLMKRMS